MRDAATPVTWSPPTADVLIAVARGGPADPGLLRRADPAEVFTAAMRNRLVAMLAAYLAGASTLPPGWSTVLQRARQAGVATELLHARTLDELGTIAGALEDAGIEHLVVKGPVVAERLYPTPALRPYLDLDLVVPRRRVGDAVDALAAAGLTPRDQNWTLYRDEVFGQVHLSTASRLGVDLHWHLLNRSRDRDEFDVDMEAVFRRARRVRLGDHSVTTLSAVDTVLHLAMHAALGGGDRLDWALDVAAACRTEEFEPHELVEGAWSWRAARPVAVMLRRAAAVTGEELVPDFDHMAGLSRAFTVATQVVDRLSPIERHDGVGAVHRVIARSARATAGSSAVDLARRAVAAAGITTTRDRGEFEDPRGSSEDRRAFLEIVRGTDRFGRTDDRPRLDPGYGIVLVARSRHDGTPPLGDWQLAKALRGRVPMLYVDPVEFAHHVAVPGERGRLRPKLFRAEGMHVLRAVAPPGAGRIGFAHAPTHAILARQIDRAARAIGIGGNRVVVVSDPMRGPVPELDRRLLVYWRRDDFRARLRGADRRLIAQQDVRLMTSADITIGISPGLRDQAAQFGNATFIPNAADVRLFAAADGTTGVDHDPESPVLGFVGGLGWRVDFDLVAALAEARPDCRVVLVGDGETEVSLPGNVERLGSRPHAALPAIVRTFDVGLIPYTTNAFNRNSFPLKVFEYLAAGVPVVSTQIDALEAYAPHVRVAADPDAFVAAVEQALEEGPDAKSCRAAADGETWDDRADRLLAVLDDAAVTT